MESKYSYICVGYKFKSKCGYDLEVVEVFSPSAVKVVDILGRSKVLSSTAIANRIFKWTYIDGSFCDNIGARKPRVVIGDILSSNYYGKFEVVSQEGKFYSIKFVNSGYVKQCCTAKNLLNGTVCDNSVEQYSTTREKYKAGTIIENKSGDKLVVLEYISSSEVKCKWLHSGVVCSYTTTALNKPANLVHRDRIKYEHSGHYIYYVYYQGVVVYVGRGKGKRYMHPNSGKSSCRELNKLHFLGTVFEVEIVEDSLSYEQSKISEKIHIKKFTGLFNSIEYS